MLNDLVTFQRDVIRKILTTDSLDVPYIVKLSEEQVSIINSLIESYRPCHRLQKSIPVRDTFALLLPDYCYLSTDLRQQFSSEGPVISVEIKPKQGFVNPVDGLSAAPYCLKQFEKMKQGSISSRSDYCPLDLYSGCPVRQRRAIISLMQSPQNNFRIFKDLKFVYGEEERGNICSILDQVFPTNTSANLIHDSFIRIILHGLNNTPFTKTCSELDHLFPATDSYCQLHNHTSESICSCSLHCIQQDSVLCSILNGQRLDSLTCQQALEIAHTLNSKNPNFITELRSRKLACFGSPTPYPGETMDDFYFRQIWQYFVSLTLKDCSIIITMQRVRGDETLIQECNRCSLFRDEVTGLKFLISVAVVDLDPRFPLTFAQLVNKILQKDLAAVHLQDHNANVLVSKSEVTVQR